MNGVWTSPDGQYKRVSAVLVFRKLRADNLPTAPVRLYHHHAPTRPLRGELTRFPQAVPVGGRLDLLDGISIGNLFGLASDWLSEPKQLKQKTKA